MSKQEMREEAERLIRETMEKRNLVRRTRDPKDRRKYYVSLQDEGRRLVD